MSNPISEYQRWKQQGEDLRAKAKQAIETRYRELLLEAIQLAEEYKADFGKALKPPSAVTSFRYKAVGRAAAKKKPAAKAPGVSSAAPKAAAPKRAAAKPAAKAVAAAPAENNAGRVKALEKKLAAARQKLDAAQTGGAPTQNLEDRIYELEDDLRLLNQL